MQSADNSPRSPVPDAVHGQEGVLELGAHNHPARDILGVNIASFRRADAVSAIDDAIGRRTCQPVAFANANLLHQASETPALRTALQEFLILNDGVGADIASRILFGRRFADNLNGTDFIPHYLGKARRPLRIFLLGARPDVAARAARSVQEAFPRHTIAGVAHGYFRDSEQDDLIATIRAARADLLLVAMGNPRQELWLARHLPATGCAVGVGVGALFDFLAGEVVRAPLALRRLRLEWLWRLAQEPRRLFRRYCVETPSFLGRVMQQRQTMQRRRRARI